MLKFPYNMIINGLKANLSPLRALILAIFFTLSGLNCQAAANQCEELFAARSSPWIENLAKASPDAQKFWRDTGKKFQETLQKDLDNNSFFYKEAMLEKHPTIEAMFKLGFQYKSGRFIAPDFFFLMKNLDFMRQASGQPFEFKLLWTLEHKDYGLEQAMVFTPFQDFPAAGLSYKVKTSIIPNDGFMKMIRKGQFPLGGLESATDILRATAENSPNFSYIVSDFMHDLSHVQGFINNPEFAQSYINAYKIKDNRWKQLEKKIGKEKMLNYKRVDEGKLTTFIFSESAWGFHPELKPVLAKLPFSNKLISGQEVISGAELRILPAEDQALLRSELKVLESKWWSVVDVYGGAAADLINYPRFSAKYQMPMNVVHTSLKNINRKENWGGTEFQDAALVLRFLREAPNFTPKNWEYFAVVQDLGKSKIYSSLRAIFEGHNGSQMSGFTLMAHFLGITDTSKL
jgi:hypothetical protein